MIQLNKIVNSIENINPIWTFSNYCNVPAEYFNGSTIKIKSIFKPDEKTPSLCFYYKDNKYKFNCFSTSKRGDHVTLVKEKFNLTYSESCCKIISDYSKWALDSQQPISTTSIVAITYKVDGVITRNWNTLDKEFWLKFGIGTTLLNWGYVKPISKYRLYNGIDQLIIIGEHIYGYFTQSGELYKVYQPMKPDFKFITVNSKYEIGSEHKEGNKYYAILSSWKDALSFKNLNLSLDLKVPSSENNYFSKEYMAKLKKDYKGGFTLMDNDDTGKKAMNYYKEKYNISFVYLPLSKDFSDSIENHGKNKVRNIVVPLIHKALNK